LLGFVAVYLNVSNRYKVGWEVPHVATRDCKVKWLSETVGLPRRIDGVVERHSAERPIDGVLLDGV